MGGVGSQDTNGADAHPIPVLFQVVPALNEYVPVIVLKSSHGSVASLQEPLLTTDSVIDTSPFQSLMGNLEKIDMGSIKYQSFLVFGFNGGLSAEVVYAALVSHGCDIVGVNCVQPDVCTAVCRRPRPILRKRFVMDVVMTHVYTVKHVRGPQSAFTKDDFVFDLLAAWLQSGSNSKVNFEVKTSISESTVEDLKEEWRGHTKDEIEAVILAAEEKVRCGRAHSQKEKFINKMGRKVMAHVMSACPSPACVRYVGGHDMIGLAQYVGVADVVCRTFDVIGGGLIEFPVLSWLTENRFKEYTLVLHGDSNLGKTQLAMTMLNSIADIIYESPDRPYYIKVETIEGLKEAASGYIKKGVALLFDDIEPSKVRGTRKGSTLEDLKHLCEVGTTSTLHARFRDIVIDENEPRCFTSNATTPHDWHDGLPHDVFLTSDILRRAYSPGVKAVFKRAVFAHVQSSIIPDELRNSYTIKRRRPDMGASSSHA